MHSLAVCARALWQNVKAWRSGKPSFCYKHHFIPRRKCKTCMYFAQPPEIRYAQSPDTRYRHGCDGHGFVQLDCAYCLGDLRANGFLRPEEVTSQMQRLDLLRDMRAAKSRIVWIKNTLNGVRD